jgi:ADP-ribosylglycohydrolase
MAKFPIYDKKEIKSPIWTDDTSQMFCVIESLIESNNDFHSFKNILKEDKY